MLVKLYLFHDQPKKKYMETNKNVTNVGLHELSNITNIKLLDVPNLMHVDFSEIILKKLYIT